MKYRLGLAMCMLWLPGVALAQDAPGASKEPERLLPASTQIFLRWDGVQEHRAAYNKSALGKTLKGDLGKFLAGLLDYTRTTLIPLLRDQVDPKVLEDMADNGTKFLQGLGKHGFALGIEVRKGEPVHAQATVIFPKAGTPPSAFLSLMRNLTGLGGAEVKQLTLEGKAVSHLDANAVHALWWNDDGDAVLVFGTETPAAVLKNLHGKSARLTANPLYKQLQDFKEFSTWGRGFVNTAALVQVARAYGPAAGNLVEDFGVAGIQNITLQSGFDGLAERSVVEFHASGERKGLLRMFGRKTFKVADLPPLPADLTSVYAGNLDLAETYDVITKTIVNIARVVDENAAGFVEDFINQIDSAVGVKIRADLLGSLDDRVVVYDSPGDGPLGLGQVILIKVKDATKLQKALSDLAKAATGVQGVPIEFKTRKYQGVATHELHLSLPGFIYTPTYAIHKGWFVLSYYPQPIHGFLLRSKGDLKPWQPSLTVRKTLDKMPGEFVGLSIADPRPRLRLLLSLLPLGASALNSFVPQAQFDVGILPNADAVTRYLFPNVTVTTDDGKTIRMETRASLALPF
jgi:hypothetical protein